MFALSLSPNSFFLAFIDFLFTILELYFIFGVISFVLILKMRVLLCLIMIIHILVSTIVPLSFNLTRIKC